ncbi:DnaJ-type Zn finger domain protein, partial [Giardia duodenalis]
VRPGQRAFRWGSPRSGSLREEAAEAPPSAAHNPVHTTAILLIPLFVVSALAVTCQTGKCETVGSAEICTECRAGGVPVGGFCWPPAPPRPRQPGAPRKTGLPSTRRQPPARSAATGTSSSWEGATRQPTGPAVTYAQQPVTEYVLLVIQITSTYSRTRLRQ